MCNYSGIGYTEHVDHRQGLKAPWRGSQSLLKAGCQPTVDPEAALFERALKVSPEVFQPPAAIMERFDLSSY